MNPSEEQLMVDVLKINAGKQIEMIWTFERKDSDYVGC